jgi:hypothetical protein
MPSPSVLDSQIGMNSPIVAGIVWSYILSCVLARGLWASIYNKLIVTFDLSPSQGWILPLSLNLLVAFIGISQGVVYVISLWRRKNLPIARHVGSGFCIAGAFICIRAAIMTGVFKHEQIGSALTEWRGGNPEIIFSAGQISNGVYSNEAVGISLVLPSGWYPMSLNSIRRAQYSGAHQAFGKNSQTAEELTATRQGIYPLLAVRKHPITYTGYNPSLYLAAYDRKAVAASSGAKSSEEFAKNYTTVQPPFYVQNGLVRQQFSGATGYYIRIENRLRPEAIVQQHLYTCENSRYYITLAASVLSEEDFTVLKQSISTLVVKEPAARE